MTADFPDIMQNVASVLGLSRRTPVSPLRIVSSIEAGLPVAALDRVSRLVAPADAGFKYHIVPRATLARRNSREAKRLSPEESGRLARIARIWAAAEDVWGNAEAARAFLFRPHPMLEGRRPMDVALGSEIGAQLVDDILGRLKYGSAA